MTQAAQPMPLRYGHQDRALSPRHTLIDLVKGLLTAGMVLAHVIQLLLADQLALQFFSDTANLLSFSGFFFCFGFVAWLAYWKPDTLRWAAMLRTALKCYGAFTVSGVAFKVLVAHAPLNAALICRVILLRDIPGYSEFLLAFSLALIAASLMRPLVRWATDNGLHLALAGLACLAATFLPKIPGQDPLLALWMGGVEFAYFPVIPYGPLFLGGIYAARHGPALGSKPLALAITVTAICAYARRHGILEERFPPTAFWIIRSFAGFYIYLGIAQLLNQSRLDRVKAYFMTVGRHVLLYLLCSNLAIFSLHRLNGGRTLATHSDVLVYVGIMSACYLLHAAIDSLMRRRKFSVPC